MHASRFFCLAGLASIVVACSDDGVPAADSASGGGSSGGITDPTTGGTTAPGSTGVSADATSDGSATTTSGPADPTTSTGAESSSADGTSGETTPPGTESSSGEGTSTSSGGETTTTGPAIVCNPGETMCVNANQVAACLADGTGFDAPTDCPLAQECYIDDCTPLCQIAIDTPSSVGCSFLTTKVDNFFSNVFDPTQNDSLVVGNVSDSLVATAQLWFVPVGGVAEQAVGNAVQIQPQSTFTWQLDAAEIDSLTALQVGGVYRVETDIPVVAYSHSPLAAVFTNDSSVLLPEHALTGNYIVSSYPGTIGPYPSYFTAIAIADGTTVDFTVGAATAAGAGVAALNQGETGQVAMDRWDMLNVVVAAQTGGDLSGTVITADQPLVVIGGTECANVPDASTFYCDHVEEVLLPLEYWGQEYVAAHAPTRGIEGYHWRVYSGDAAVTIDTEPPQVGFPIQLDAGEYYQFETSESFVATGDGPFLAVQYLEGQTGGGGTGDPAMIQSVPVEQFLSRYAFITGTGYNFHYAQIIRPAGGAEVTIDGVQVGGYYALGAYEIADWPVTEGAHFAVSDDPFGIVQVGYSEATSYGYPGGLRLMVINPQ